MADFDTLLRDALVDGAERAPSGGGLAGGARDRARSRRNRRVAIGASAAVLAVAVPVGIAAVAGGGADRPGPGPAGTPTVSVGVDQGWRAVSYDGAELAVPGDWTSVECPLGDWTQLGPEPPGPCHGGTGVAFYASATFDPRDMPGVITRNDAGDRWGGYVYAGEWALFVQTPDRELTRQVLATVHEKGQPEVGAASWEEFSRDGISWEFPAGWGVGEGADLSGYGVCASDVTGNGPLPSPVESQQDPAHYRIERQVDDHLVTVVAPTRAVADLVLATVEEAPGAPYGRCGLPSHP